jgi:hypothetical protein
VVGERQVGRNPFGDLPRGGDVAGQVGVELGLGEVLEGLGLEALVAVGDVDRQEAAEVGPVDDPPDRLAADVDAQRAAVPVAGRIDPLELERRAVLAEHVHLVPRPHQRRRELRVVDVRAGPLEEIAVEDEDGQGAHSCALTRRVGRC